LLPQAYAANWAVPDWYLDGTIGDDANDGTSAVTPLRTGAELMRRLGPYALWNQSVTVHVLANGMVDALVLRGVMLVAGTHLDVIGTPTQLADAGTVATYAPRNHATPVADQITSTLIADWTPYQWARVRVTGGANAGVVCWVANANPAGVGVATARISKPAATNTTSNTNIVNVSPVLVVGDPIVIETLPTVPAVCIYLDGPVSQVATPAYARRQLFVADVDAKTLQLRSNAYLGTYVSVQRSRVANAELFAGNASSSVVGIIAGCLIYNSEPATSYRMPIGVAQNCLFDDHQLATLLTTSCNAIGANLLFRGIRFSASNSVMVTFVDVQIFDCPGAASIAAQLNVGRVTNLSGSGNAGYGLGVTNNATIAFTGTQNLQGAISNGRLISAPSISLTLPQLLQPSDYAQKGITPAMVAGTTTVTVPWYDNATQRVDVTHAAFAGTPGILSVQQISTTQFTVTSSNALDTSTVNWTISPLGRNIFISTV
jgi:hypothetical protein